MESVTKKVPETLTVDVTDVAHGGDGVARVDGLVCFVPGGLPGDRLRVGVTRRAKNALWTRIEAIVEASPGRMESPCPDFGHCGCQWSHFKYPAQGEWKRRIVQEALRRIAGIGTSVDWCESPKLRLGYRTRAEFHGDGKRLGFHAPGTHNIMGAGTCPVCHPKLAEALEALRGLGLKGTVTVTVNPDGGEVLVWTKFVKRKLKQYFPLSQTPKDEKIRHAFRFDGVPVVNGAFSQSSLLLNRLLVKTVWEFLGDPPSVLDLYCGSGNFSLGLSGKTEVLGIDHNKAAIKAAYAVRPGAYVTGGEAKMRTHITKSEAAAILLDPPRSGAKALLPALQKASAQRIVYVSCDPATLARDLKELAQGGWRLRRVAAVDMFPNTPHIETVCSLERDG